MIVVDTNVILRGLRSNKGASFLILQKMLTGELRFAASPAVVLEYEDVLKRPGHLGHDLISPKEIDQVLDAICAKAVAISPWYRFRPFLSDPKDDLFVDCALAAGARTIVSYDRHFDHPSVGAFGLIVVNSGAFAKNKFKEGGL